MKRFGAAASLTILMTLSAQGQAPPAHLATPLHVDNIRYVHQPDEGQPGNQLAVVNFTLLNEASRQLIAYSADVKGVMFDGSTRVLGVCDAGPDVAFKHPESRLQPPLGPGQRRDCESKFSAPPIDLPRSIAITPVYAVLDDCTLMGDRAAALRAFFEPQRAAAAIYAGYLADLRAILKSPGNLRDALEVYIKNYQAPTAVVQSYASNSPASRAAKFASDQVMSVLLTQLRNNSAHVAPEKLLQDHLALVQLIFDDATKHSTPK